MDRQTITAAMPPHWLERLKGAQFGFIGGILIGLIFGWFFHGVISMAIRFGMLILLLLPLIVIGWLWFRAQRSAQSRAAQPPQPPVAAPWQAIIDVERVQPAVPPEPPASTLIDVPLVRSTAASKPDDIEAELEALKRERGS